MIMAPMDLTSMMIMAPMDLIDGTIGQVFLALLYHCANLSSRLVESKLFLRYELSFRA
jgi:hypothetical protein